MSEQIEKSKTRRKPWTAVILSAILPGLGHIYCGQIVIGLILMFMTSFFFPVIVFDTYRVKPTANGPEYGLVFFFSAMTVLIGLVALIDSYRQARRTRFDYQLKEYNRWYVYFFLVFIFCGGAVGYSLQIKDRYIEAFSVPAHSMVPTILNGDRILANKTAYRVANPKRGDIVLFSNPDNRNQNYIKRVVAFAGDTVEIKDSRLIINGQPLQTTEIGPLTYKGLSGTVQGTVYEETNADSSYRIFIAENTQGKPVTGKDFEKFTVPKYSCFLLGDNRNLSHDSRNFGPIAVAALRGKFGYLYFPAKDLSRFGPVK